MQYLGLMFRPFTPAAEIVLIALPPQWRGLIVCVVIFVFLILGSVWLTRLKDPTLRLLGRTLNGGLDAIGFSFFPVVLALDAMQQLRSSAIIGMGWSTVRQFPFFALFAVAMIPTFVYGGAIRAQGVKWPAWWGSAYGILGAGLMVWAYFRTDLGHVYPLVFVVQLIVIVAYIWRYRDLAKRSA